VGDAVGISTVGTAVRGRLRAALLVAVLLGAGLAGCSAQVQPVAEKPAPARSGPATSPAASAVRAFRSVRTYQEVALPARLRIPAQHINTRLQRLGLAADGTIAAPSGWQVAGWYDQGPRPGQKGRAVIVGHVDSRSGPAVFFDLARLRTGDAVYVDRADGSTTRFQVTGRRQVPKDRFPAEAVYSPTLQASLMLMTCGGSFDHSTGHYRDNLIVFAVPG
jgi:LPXTG-site transpeptidase (sortase) family protein